MTGPEPGEPKVHTPQVPLESVLDDIDEIVARAGDAPMSLAELETALRGRGAAILILVLSIPFIIPIPIPFLALAFCMPMMAMGLRIAWARDGRLPDFARRRSLRPETLRAIAKGLRRVLRPIAWLFRPRFEAMFWPLPWRLTGVSICLGALVLSLPLPIPLANLIPAIGLIHLAAGLLQRDGAAICVGHIFTIGGWVYLILVWNKAMELLWRIFT